MLKRYQYLDHWLEDFGEFKVCPGMNSETLSQKQKTKILASEDYFGLRTSRRMKKNMCVELLSSCDLLDQVEETTAVL